MILVVRYTESIYLRTSLNLSSRKRKRSVMTAYFAETIPASLSQQPDKLNSLATYQEEITPWKSYFTFLFAPTAKNGIRSVALYPWLRGNRNGWQLGLPRTRNLYKISCTTNEQRSTLLKDKWEVRCNKSADARRLFSENSARRTASRNI